MTLDAGDANGPDLFSKVSVDRVSQVIIDQVRALIRSGRLAQGERLPSERELSQKFGVSRVTVREALRVLEANGLVGIKVGAHGGAFVSSPTKERLGEGLADLLTPLTPAVVTEARQIIEIGILPLVVERATEKDIEELFRMVDEGQEAVDQGNYTMHMSAAFHIRVSECSHNPAMEALVHGFHGPLLMSLRAAQVVAPRMGTVGTDEHRALVQAISNQDLDAATNLMKTHLERTAARLLSDHLADQKA